MSKVFKIGMVFLLTLILIGSTSCGPKNTLTELEASSPLAAVLEEASTFASTSIREADEADTTSDSIEEVNDLAGVFLLRILEAGKNVEGKLTTPEGKALIRAIGKLKKVQPLVGSSSKLNEWLVENQDIIIAFYNKVDELKTDKASTNTKGDVEE